MAICKILFEMFNKLNIPYYPSKGSLDTMSRLLDTKEKNDINISLWDFNFSGKVEFSICHDGNTIYLKFFVTEKDVVAKYIYPNDPVYKDSCVEFFIAFGGDDKYYNLEFNSSGTCLAMYGVSKNDREFLPVENIREIKTISSYRSEEDRVNWELTIAIPKETFSHHDIDSFCGKVAKVNFYKCGDDLPQPHYLCWNNIESTEANFHLPEFFGEAIFGN